EPFELYPDFQQGGLMDVRDYADGNGRIVLRAKIDIDGRELVTREIPATTTTESLVASIEKAAEKNKIKISSISDYTTGTAEIRIVPTRTYDPQKTRQGLYMYTKCSDSISVNMTVIRDNRPVTMTVSEVLRRNVDKLLEILKRELEIDLDRQNELFHAKTLAQIFFENRIYKRIEECRSQEDEYNEVRGGLQPFLDQLRREVTNADIDKLLALPVRRISRFDIEKNQRELAEIEEKIAEIRKNLAHLKKYAIDYLLALIAKYGKHYPRHTEIEHIERIDRHEAALNNIKVGWDRKNGYVGTAIKSDDTLVCNEFDRFICVEKSGAYRVIALPPEKLFIGKLYDFRRFDAENEFGVIYRETKSGKYYGKRSSIGGFIMEKQYMLCPAGCKLELMTPRADAIYSLVEANAKGATVEREINLMELPQRSPKARGILISSKSLNKITHVRYLTEEELAGFAVSPSDSPLPEDDEEEKIQDAEIDKPEEDVTAEAVTEPAVEPVAEPVAEPVVEPVAEPVAEPVVEPVAEPVAEPVVEPPQEVAEPPVAKSAAVSDKPHRRKASTPPSKEIKPPKKGDASDDDEFGIVQQEFGF
ncbi:MAG: DNA gyrase subunit A, partial [Victivallaceae bacterium]|nr:DNA gyrase subunit A [Victivallaceae bacterium]